MSLKDVNYRFPDIYNYGRKVINLKNKVYTIKQI